MAYRTRKTPDVIVNALVAAHNLRQLESVASFFHADTTQRTSGDYTAPTVADDVVASANATDLATLLTLVNEIKAVTNRHFADTLAHDTDTTAAVTEADATDAATAATLATAVKDQYTVHITDANVHFNNDGTNTVTNADATDQATAITLANEIKGDLNAHIVSAPAGAMINLVPA